MRGRREFMTLLGGAATLPLAARAQQPTMPVIGFLHPASRDANANRLRGFHRGMKEVGYVEGENVAIVYRFAENEPDLERKLEEFRTYYNEHRVHQSLNGHTPVERS